MARSVAFEKEIAFAVKVIRRSEQDIALRIEVLLDILRAAGVEFRLLQEIRPDIKKLPRG
jgi:hypothetical protein